MARIVDSVLVDEDRADQSTELDQCVPVTSVAGETRSLDRKHRADATVTDCGQQPLEAWTGDASARPSEIVVDDLDGRPTKPLGAVGKPILPSLAFKIVHQLIRGRLTDINASDALEMLDSDLAHGCCPGFLRWTSVAAISRSRASTRLASSILRAGHGFASGVPSSNRLGWRCSDLRSVLGCLRL